MIYFLLFLDVLINNYTQYTSYFFIPFLYNKPYKDYLLTFLILDLIIFKKPYNFIILSFMYLINKLFKPLNKNNIFCYLFMTIFNYILYISLSNLLIFNNFKIILIKIGQNLIFNFIFYLLSFNVVRKGHYE